MYGPVNSRFAVGPFVAGAPMVGIGVLFLVGLSSTTADIIGWLFVAAGIVLLAWSIVMFRKLSHWNKLRKGKWSRVRVLMVVDDAYGEREKTLLDTKDGKYRIALVHYPLELRDEIEMKNQIEYVGELANDSSVLVRLSSGSIEYFGRVRTLASLRAEGTV
ncbi:MAG: hypothetical protein ACK5MR_18055 [Cumulibacter sp.]